MDDSLDTIQMWKFTFLFLNDKHWVRCEHWVGGQTLGWGLNIGFGGKYWVSPWGEMLILRQIKSLEKVCRPIGGPFSSTVSTNLLRSGQHWVRGQTLGQGMNIVSKGKYWVRDWTLGWSSNIGLGGKYWVWGKHWVRERTLGQGANIGLEGKHWVGGQTLGKGGGQTLGQGTNIWSRDEHRNEG